MRVIAILGAVALVGAAVCCTLADPTDDAVHYGWQNDEGRTETFEEESMVHWDTSPTTHFADLKLRFWNIGSGTHQARVTIADTGELLDPNIPTISWQNGIVGEAQTYEFQGAIAKDDLTNDDIVTLLLEFGDNLGDADATNDVVIWEAQFFLERLGQTSWAGINECLENSDGELYIVYLHTVSTTFEPEHSFGMQYAPGGESLTGNELWTYLDQFHIPRDTTYIRRTFHWLDSPLPANSHAHFRQMIGPWPLNLFAKPITPH